MAPPTIAPSIKVIKTFNYRGSARQFSNRYFFTDLKPADDTKWTTLADAVTAAEKAIYPNIGGFTISEVNGYDAGSEIPVFTKTYTLAGTGTFSSNTPMPGDVAAMVRYSTPARSTKNHPIYLFNYYHNVVGTTGANSDTLHPGQKAAMETYANAWITGFSDGAVTHERCGPYGRIAQTAVVSQYLRHRDFPAG